MSEANSKEAFEFLKDWAKKYFKNRDLNERKVAEIVDQEDGMKIKYKDSSSADIFCNISLEALRKDLAKHTEKSFGVVLNSSENIDYLQAQWGYFEGVAGLCIFFINPFSSKDTKWSMFPHTHSMISEKSAISKGIKVIASSVDKIDEKKLLANIKKAAN